MASVNEAFDVLCRAGVRLSSAFSMFGFWMVIFITTMTIWDGFMLSSSLRKWKMENNSSFLGYGIDRIMLWVFMDLLALVITCLSADLPARQVTSFLRYVCYIFLNETLINWIRLKDYVSVWSRCCLDSFRIAKKFRFLLAFARSVMDPDVGNRWRTDFFMLF